MSETIGDKKTKKVQERISKDERTMSDREGHEKSEYLYTDYSRHKITIIIIINVIHV